jgi:hypothetical protein
VIPATVKVELMGEKRAPLASLAASSEAALAYGALWTRVHAAVMPQSEKKLRKAPAKRKR